MCLIKLTTSNKEAFSFCKRKTREKENRSTIGGPSLRAGETGRGQLSVEFLLVAAAFLGILSLFVSVFQSVYENATFALDVLEAQRFCDEFVSKSNELSLLGNGSVSVIEAKPLQEWGIRVSDLTLLVTVFSDSGKSKLFSRELGFSGREFSITISSAESFRLMRENNLLVVESDS